VRWQNAGGPRFSYTGRFRILSSNGASATSVDATLAHPCSFGLTVPNELSGMNIRVAYCGLKSYDGPIQDAGDALTNSDKIYLYRRFDRGCGNLMRDRAGNGLPFAFIRPRKQCGKYKLWGSMFEPGSSHISNCHPVITTSILSGSLGIGFCFHIGGVKAQKSSQPRNFMPIQVDDLSHRDNGNMRCRNRWRERHFHMVSGDQTRGSTVQFQQALVRLRSTAAHQ
jgi:hypothetical protein